MKRLNKIIIIIILNMIFIIFVTWKIIKEISKSKIKKIIKNNE